jgi:protein gp37
MSETTKIQWTDVTWNIARGCTKVDEDCKYCYMYRDSFSSTRYNPLDVVRTKTVFDLPLRIKEPSKIFTCSLTDFFHEAIDNYRNEAWDIIRRCPQHTFQVLTKRPERITEHLPEDWGEGWKNVWLGTSCGSQKAEQRIVDLVHSCDAKIKFLSLEPLHAPINLTSITKYYEAVKESFYVLPGIDWVIVGGESGNETGKYRYRPCEIEWIEKIIKDCKQNHIPVFVKQLGTHLAKKLGLKDRHGGDMDEWPEQLRIREFPRPLA